MEPRDVSRRSKWLAATDLLRGFELHPDKISNQLKNLSIGDVVLMPCSDDWVQATSRLDADEHPNVRSWTSSPETIDTLVNKKEFRAQLEADGVPHPVTRVISGPDDLANLPDSSFHYAFLKPHDSHKFLAQCGVKGVMVADKNDAIKKLANIHKKGLQVVIQEYVPGPPTNHIFVDGYRSKTTGEIRLLARRRLRMFPRDFGNSTDMVTIEPDSAKPALESLDVLFQSLNFKGIFSAEFKIDDRDREFKLLEVNCRPWWYVDYADRCGLHACKYAYQEALDLPLDQFNGYALGKRCVYPIYDWSARRDNKSESSEDGGLLDMLKTWLTAYQPVFAWSDPMPAIANFFELLRKAYRRRIKPA